MATLAFIRGWVNASSDLADEIRKIVYASIDGASDDVGDERFRASLKQCWHFPADDGPAGDFVLLGATVNANLLPLIVAQLSSIAQDVRDDDAGLTYHVAGRFEVTIEGQREDQQWIIADGRLDTSRRLPYLLSP